jgi:hypothetical protein
MIDVDQLLCYHRLNSAAERHAHTRLPGTA